MLITGFHDWRELEGNVWRCRDNPACQLLIGPEATQTPPLVRSGALVTALAATVTNCVAARAQGDKYLARQGEKKLPRGVADRADRVATLLVENAKRLGF